MANFRFLANYRFLTLVNSVHGCLASHEEIFYSDEDTSIGLCILVDWSPSPALTCVRYLEIVQQVMATDTKTNDNISIVNYRLARFTMEAEIIKRLMQTQI